jgi:hypothetical protein
MTFAGFRNRGTACGCCDEDECIIGQDLFDAALAASLWTIISGAPSVSGGSLILLAGDKLEMVPVPASASDGVSASVAALSTDATASFRLHIGKADENNYLFGTVAKSGGAITLQLGKVADGVETLLTDTLTVQDTGSDTDLRHRIKLCLNLSDVEAERTIVTDAMPWRADDNDGFWDSEDFILEFQGAPATSSFDVGEDLTDIINAYFKFPLPVGAVPTQVNGGWEASKSDVDPSVVTDYLAQLFDSGGLVGTNQAIEAYSLADASDTTVGGYDPGNTWGASLTRDIVGSDTFGISMQFRRADILAGTTVNLYHVAMTLTAVVPEMRTGRLRLSYDNTSILETDCVTDWLVQVSGGGLNGTKAGVESVVGEWDLADFIYSYQQSETRTGCDACDCSAEDAEPCDCCGDVAGASEYVIVLDNNHTEPPVAGHPDWTPCPLCSGFTGAFTLRNNEFCGWLLFQYPFDCPNITAENEEIGFGCGGVGRSFALSLVESGESCKWRLVVQLWADLSDCGGEGPGLSGNYAIYESADLSPAGDCRANMPITLNKTEEGYVASLPYCDYLGLGTISWGATATLDIA